MSEKIDVKAAAGILGISGSGIIHAIRRGRFPAEKVGRDWMMDEETVRKYAETRKRGWPKGRSRRPRTVVAK